MATDASGRMGGSGFVFGGDASALHASFFGTIPLPLHSGHGTNLGGAGGETTTAPLPLLSFPSSSVTRRFAASISLFRCARSFFDGLARTEPSPRQRTQAVAGTMAASLDGIASDKVIERDLLFPTRGKPLLPPLLVVPELM